MKSAKDRTDQEKGNILHDVLPHLKKELLHLKKTFDLTYMKPNEILVPFDKCFDLLTIFMVPIEIGHKLESFRVLKNKIYLDKIINIIEQGFIYIEKNWAGINYNTVPYSIEYTTERLAKENISYKNKLAQDIKDYIQKDNTKECLIRVKIIHDILMKE